MSRFRRYLDSLKPYFSERGGLARYRVIYEAADTFFYTPAVNTRSAPHVRDGIDLKRTTAFLILALLPCIAAALWNIGYQANSAMPALGAETIPGWRGEFIDLLNVGYDPDNAVANLCHGLVYFLPVFIVAFVSGSFWEILFAVMRRRELNEGILAMSLLFTLTLPPTIPLWQVAVGISFGVVIGKEAFGGTGKNFVNPVLAGRAFLYFAYPAQIAGNSIWTAVDGFSGATPLGLGATGGLEKISAAGITWPQAFLGQIQGAMGETSTLACLLGGAFLVYTGITSWRVISAIFIGMIVTVLVFNIIGSDSNPMFTIPWYWHLVLGGFAFGTMFLATDAVTSANTNPGRWLYGLFIGVLIVTIRIANPTIPECTMFAILLGNIFAPLFDYLVIQIYILKRRRRHDG